MDMQISYTQLRENLSSILDKIENDSLVCSIERRGHGRAVLMSESDYNSLNETLYLLGSKNNREALEESMTQVTRGETVTFNSVEDLDKYISNMPNE